MIKDWINLAILVLAFNLLWSVLNNLKPYLFNFKSWVKTTISMFITLFVIDWIKLEFPKELKIVLGVIVLTWTTYGFVFVEVKK